MHLSPTGPFSYPGNSFQEMLIHNMVKICLETSSN